MIRLILLSLLPLLAACEFNAVSEHRPSDTQPADVALEEEEFYRWWMTEDGRVEYETDPYQRRPVRRGEHDIYVTLLARDVALVVEPAKGAPVGVSNMLASALVRRFAGELPLKEALSAAKVFIIQPVVSSDGARLNGALVVDWRLRDERKTDIGVVYAARRLSGAIDQNDPWKALTYDDAEHIALQTAAHLVETPDVRAAVFFANTVARVDATPTPVRRPTTE